MEDITNLKENSVVDSFIMYIDSGNRNRLLGPTPSEYIVEFDEPFKNVVSLEVLDGSVARTMYIIDKYNDSFSYNIRYNNNNYDRKVVFDHQDYNFETLMSEANILLSFDIGVNPVSITSLSASTPYTRKSIIYYESKYPFQFDFRNSPIAEIFGFDEYAVKTAPLHYKFIDNQIFGSIISSNKGEERDLFTTDDIGTKYSVGINNSTTGTKDFFDTDLDANYNKVYKNHSCMQIFNKDMNTDDYADYSRSINSIELFIGLNLLPLNAADRLNKTLSLLDIKWEIRTFDAEDKILNPIMYSGDLLNSSNISLELLESTNQNIINPTSINPIYKVIINLEFDEFSNVQYDGSNGGSLLAIILHENSNINGDGGLLWYCDTSNNAKQSSEKAYSIVWNSTYDLSMHLGAGYLPFVPKAQFSLLSSSPGLRVNSSYKRYSITPTGRLVLIGERFIILRCPEIESQLSSSFGFGSNSPGLALFKLGVLGYADARFDFTTIKNKEFHPIGKLNKLHFRFETSKGYLYDFKGVNHNLLVAIKFLRPVLKQQQTNTNYILNPNYNPNMLDYMRTQNEVLDEYTTDEEENDYLKKNFNKIYMEKEKRYIDSSDEEVQIDNNAPDYVDSSDYSDEEITR